MHPRTRFWFMTTMHNAPISTWAHKVQKQEVQSNTGDQGKTCMDNTWRWNLNQTYGEIGTLLNPGQKKFHDFLWRNHCWIISGEGNTVPDITMANTLCEQLMFYNNICYQVTNTDNKVICQENRYYFLPSWHFSPNRPLGRFGLVVATSVYLSVYMSPPDAIFF